MAHRARARYPLPSVFTKFRRKETVAVRLRLTRVGGRKNPVWRVVVADQRSKRDGRVIETVGHYNAQTQPSTIVLDEERVRSWLARGAQPTDTVRKLLKIQGITGSAS
jgi:small subunit ribosomal protein S16